LLAALLQTSRAGLYLREEPVDRDAARRFEEHVYRRLAGEPLQYIIGFAEFCGHRIQVDRRVLIPRPETEVVVDGLLRALRQRPEPPRRILDLGTGSGAIAIALAHQLSRCLILGAELSWDALQVAVANITAHRMTDRITLAQTDWTDGIRGLFEVIVSNPPYVATDRIAHLPMDVQREPRLSLDGGADGMVLHRRVLDAAPRLLAPGGLIVLECAEDQASRLADEAARQLSARSIGVLPDLAGRPRAVLIDTCDSVERATA
jgi:release factor glutamine methyltransferase